MNPFRSLLSFLTKVRRPTNAPPESEYRNPRHGKPRPSRIHVTWMNSQLMPIAVVIEDPARDRPRCD